MQTRHRNPFTTIHTEGAILPSDLLQRVLESHKDLVGLSPAGYHLSGEKLTEATTRSWNRLQGSWAAFRTSRGRLGIGDAGTTLTRERWLLPLFQELGYGRLLTAKAVEIEGKSYPISHGWANVPIHLVGCGVDLDKRSAGVAGASRSSPHSLMQEYLNRSEGSLWGFVSNGLRLRVLRDNASLTRQAFLEFDLEAMFEGEVYSDFVLLWLMCHQSRVEAESSAEFILEQWSKTAQEQGTRALDQLRSGVEQAIAALGSGFLRHPANKQLIADLRSGALSPQEYYRQLLRLVYRLIFLFVAEDRDLLFDPQADSAARERYSRYYSLNRLRRLAERQRGGRHADLYVGFKLVTDILEGRYALTPGPSTLTGTRPEGRGEADIAVAGLGLPTLGSFLFSGEAVRALELAELENQSFLSAIRHLTFIEEGRSRRAVDYKNLGAEELGSVYEALLELHPVLNTDAGTFALATAGGNERKTTGSYYTPSSLIQVLLDSALDPVIEQALGAGRDASIQEQAVLDLKVCDPACGSGHFLIAASHRMARRLAAVRSGDDEPSPAVTRAALREVIAHCIYGVDANPMAVELCKVNLWLESLAPGKPLSFLDAHIQCGDSLVGVSPGLDISEIPDEAFNPAFGDDRATASALKKRNKRERGGQLGFRWDVTVLTSAEDLARWRAERAGRLDAMPEDEAEQVQAKAQAYDEYLQAEEYIQNRLELDLWTAAFFWKIPKADTSPAGGAETLLAPTQQELLQLRSGAKPNAALVDKVRELAERLNFFHWELAFPQVFSGENPGFDCVLGNPPWDALQLDEQEFFALLAPELAKLAGNERKKAIENLSQDNRGLADALAIAKKDIDSRNNYFRECGRYPLTAIGKMNTYPLFAETGTNLFSGIGRIGMVLPTGIATDDTTKDFFGSISTKKSIVSLYDFENKEGIFPGVHRSFKFCLLILSGSEIDKSSFVFFATDVRDLQDKRRRFTFAPTEISLFNPNTLTAPVFRTRSDAELSNKIYRQFSVLINDTLGQNLWQIRFKQGLFNMTSDSGLFSLEKIGGYLPLYEGKMIGFYDHRAASVIRVSENLLRQNKPIQTTLDQYKDPSFSPIALSWVHEKEVKKQLEGYTRKWLIGFKDITASTNERTAIFAILPYAGIGHVVPLVFFEVDHEVRLQMCFLANMNSIVFDYSVRQKIGGLHLTFSCLKQLPALPPNVYTPADIDFISQRVLELVYTANDLRPFAEDMGYHGEPFRWDEVRRAQLRAELDAYYARLYGLSRDELRYILDPKEVYGEDFPGETFRVLKEKENKAYGEYRTRRLVLEAWDQLEGVKVNSYTGKQVAEEQVISYQSPVATEPVREEKKEERVAPVQKAPEPVKEDPIQPMLSDFGLYKCIQCDKMVMGYEKENHEKKVHGGRSVEWRRVR